MTDSTQQQPSVLEFLEARIAEDERHALQLAKSDRRPVLSISATVDHPQRVLAECHAKRRMVEYYRMLIEQSEHAEVFGYHATGLKTAIRFAAAVYKDHPDYQEEWFQG